MEDTSLDEFIPDESEASPEEGETADEDRGDDQPADAVAEDGATKADDSAAETDDESTDTGEASPSTDPEVVEPATTTYSWSGDSGSCEACGDAVERRWRDDGRLVCDDCKEW